MRLPGRNPHPPNLPYRPRRAVRDPREAYRLTAPLRESYADGITEVVVRTAASSEAEMRLVASDLAAYRPGDGVLLVEFHERTDGGTDGEGRETGFALVFGSREAAMAPDLEYTEEEVDEIFEEDGGVRAVSYEEFSQENPALKADLERIGAS